MKVSDKMRLYSWIEFAIWLIIVAVSVVGIRYHNYKKLKHFKSYQIFMSDVDGLIVGSPVKFLGIQIGHVTKIQIVQSNVYIKFIITQEGLSLPQGSIATVEGSGLGGSKSLEIYPPKYDSDKDKIIVAKDPTRLNKVMSLFNDIFKQLDEIITTVSYATKQVDINELHQNVVIPVDANAGFTIIDRNLDSMINSEKELREKFKLDKN
ncbi:MCE family protein [bacterium]|nr:MCE family protein [bacterium]